MGINEIRWQSGGAVNNLYYARAVSSYHDMLGGMKEWQRLPILVVKLHQLLRAAPPVGADRFIIKRQNAAERE